jgi:cytochrome bd-type quinol oxidase subunit 1
MKKRIMVIGAGMAMAAMLSSGCASYMVVQGRNAELDRRAVQLAVTPNGGTAAIDLLGLKGYWEAWKAEPVKMTGATLLDVGTAAGAAYLVNQATKSNEDSKPSTPAIQNNGGTVIVNTGSGDTSYTTTTTGAAE